MKNKIFTLGTADGQLLHGIGGEKQRVLSGVANCPGSKPPLNLYGVQEKINQVVMAKIKNLEVQGLNTERGEIACATLFRGQNKRYASLIPALIALCAWALMKHIPCLLHCITMR